MTRWRALGVGILLVIALVVGVVALWLLRPPPPAPLPPRGAAPLALPDPERSVISLPIAIGLADLARSVQAGLPVELVHEQNVSPPDAERIALDVDVRRTGDVVARGGAAGALRLEVPLAFEVKANAARRAEKRAAKGREEPAGATVTGALLLDVSLTLVFADDWRWRPTAELRHRWVDKPTLKLGPLSIGVQKPVDKALAARLAEVARDLEAQLAADGKLAADLAAGWKELHQPKRLSEVPEVWLRFRPETLFATDPRVDGDALRLTVGLIAGIDTQVGSPPPPLEPGPLPPPAPPPPGRGFTLAVPVATTWESVSAAATEQLAGQSWTLPIAGFAAGKLEVTRVELYPSGTAVVAVLDYRAEHPGWSTDGRLALTATPELDPEARRIDLVDFDYLLETWDPTIASPSALAETTLEASLEERLVFPFGEQLDLARLQLDDQLAAGRTEGAAALTGRVDALEIRGVHLTDEALVVDTLARGELSVRLNALPRGPGMPRKPRGGLGG